MKRKTAVMIQGLASLALVILMAISALLPVIRVNVYPTENTLGAVAEIMSISLVSRMETASEEDLKKETDKFAAYTEKLNAGLEPEREPTEEELEKLTEFNLSGSAIYVKITSWHTLLERLNDNMSASDKQAIQKEADDLKAEILEDFSNLTYYEAPIKNKGYKITFSALDFVNGIKTTQLLSYTMTRNSLAEDLITAKSDAERESLTKKIEAQQKWLDEHKDYYKSVTVKTLDTSLFLSSITGGFSALSSKKISGNEVDGLYDIAYTDKAVTDNQMGQVMFIIFQMIAVCAFQIAALIIAVVTAIGALTALADRKKMYVRSVGGFRFMTLLSSALLLAVAFGANTALAAGGVLFVVLLVLGTLANGLLARTLQRDKTGETYLNFTQGWGLLGFIGLLVGALTLGAKGFFNSFYSRGSLFNLAKKMGVKMAGTAFNLSFLFLIVFLLAFLIFGSVLLRVSLTDKKKFDKETQNVKIGKGLLNKNLALCTAIFSGLALVLLIAFGAAFSLNIGGVAGCIAGLIIALVGSVAYMILAKKFCGELDATAKARLNMQAILSADEDLEADARIPVIGALLSENKTDENDAA